MRTDSYNEVQLELAKEIDKELARGAKVCGEDLIGWGIVDFFILERWFGAKCDTVPLNDWQMEFLADLPLCEEGLRNLLMLLRRWDG